ncbi:MAG: uncharacterized membrane protein YjjB (DUF3815 family) [Pirellulaceae bacterium]|jgi:uncharacterized membrane protein YjjB (DUF3815 family)
MNWLLWREYRLNRWILATGAVGLLLPYVLAVIFEADRSAAFIGAYLVSCLFGHLTIALLAGHAVAGEQPKRRCFESDLIV